MVSPDITLPEHAQPKPPAEKALTQAASSKTFERNKFVKDLSTSKDPLARKEKVTISPEVEQEYKFFLKNYVKNFADALKRDPSLEHNHSADADRILVEALTTHGIPDDAKIEEFFSKPEGWIVATDAMTRYAFLASAAIGFSAESDPRRKSPPILTSSTIKLDERGKLFPRIGKAIKGAIVDLPTNAFSPPAVKMGHTARVFDAIKDDSQERAYVKALTGIDINSHEAFAGVVLLSPDAVDESNRSFQQVREEIVSAINARRDFFRELGVPLNLLNTMPEEVILNDTLHLQGFEKSAATWEDDVIHEYNASHGGFRDRLGNSREMYDPATSTWVPNLNYDLNANGIDTVGNTMRFSKARRTVMLRKTTEAMTSVLGGEELNNIKGSIENKKTSLDTGTEAQKRTEAATVKKTELGTEGTAVEAKKAPLTSLGEKRQAVKNLETKLQTEFNLNIGTGLAATVDAEVARLDAELRGTPPAVGLLAARQTAFTAWDTLIKNQRDNEVTRQSQLPGKKEPVNVASVEQQIREALQDTAEKRNLDELDSKIQERRTKQASLKTLKIDYLNAQKLSAQAENEFLSNKDVPKNLVEIKNDYDGLVGVVGPTITPAQLETETIDQLITRAIALPYTIPNATPEQQKALREMLLRAKTEHKAVQIESYDLSPQLQINALTDIVNAAGATVNLDSLLTMPEQQLTFMLGQPPHNLAAADIQIKLPLARAETRKKLIIRYKTGIEEQLVDLNNQIKTQEAIINSAGNVDKIKETVDLTKRILDRREKIFDKAKEVKLDSHKYTDTTLVAPTDTEYSDSERAANLPRGYYEILNLFFDYQSGTKDISRERDYQEVSKLLPPNKMATLLNESFHLGIVPVAPTTTITISDVLHEMAQRITVNRISTPGIYRAFRAVLEKLGKEAIAL